jgi:hypothetical protein
MRLHFSEHHRYQGKPLHEAIVQKCLELKIAGATVLRGLEGYGGMAQIHRSHLLTHDLPMVVTIVDSAENIERLGPIVEEMMDTGLIAVSDVQIRRIQKSKAAGKV